MKCLHCLENFFEKWEDVWSNKDVNGHWKIRICTCPSCNKFIIELEKYHTNLNVYTTKSLIRPKSITRAPLDQSVDPKFAEEYQEACIVLSDSPKASAALSRRCLQHLLREKESVTKGNLYDEIQEVLDKKNLPGHLAEGLNAVRIIGNFAAHPIKSDSTGEIVDVEPGEAEWNLDILEGLFDFYFVQPKILQTKRDALNEKLGDVGKKPMK